MAADINWLLSEPRIEKRHSAGMKVGHVAGHHRHAMDEGRRGDQSIALAQLVWDVQPSALKRHGRIDSKYTSSKRREHMTIQPRAHDRSLRSVAPLNLQDTHLEFK
jgi:hypothetical protein